MENFCDIRILVKYNRKKKSKHFISKLIPAKLIILREAISLKKLIQSF